MAYFASIALLLMLISTPAFAEDREYKGADDFLSSLPATTKLTKVMQASGDLNGAHLDDLAILVQSMDSGRKTSQLFMLLNSGDGGYRLATGTKQIVTDQLSINVKIHANQLYVSVASERGGGWGTNQFEPHNGAFRLVMLRLHLADFDQSTNVLRGVDTAFNLLNGDVAFTNIVTHKVERFKVARDSCYLADYDFDLFFCLDLLPSSSGDLSDHVFPH